MLDNPKIRITFHFDEPVFCSALHPEDGFISMAKANSLTTCHRCKKSIKYMDSASSYWEAWQHDYCLDCIGIVDEELLNRGKNAG